MFRNIRKISRILLFRRLFAYRHANHQTKRMFRAIRNNSVSLVKSLLKTGKVNLNAREGFPGNGYLHLSVYLGNVAITKLLLKAGCKINASNFKRYTPLHLALHWALMSPTDRLNIVKLLLKHGSNVNAVNSDGDTPLHVMVRSNASHVKLIKLLLKHGADIGIKNNDDKLPVHEYIFTQEEWFGVEHTLLKLLLPDEQPGMSPLHRASLFHQSSVVREMLLNNGSEVDEKDEFGRTPLFYAIVAKRDGCFNEEKISTVRLLLDHGAEVNQRYARRSNMLIDMAFRLRDAETIRIFLEYMAKLLELLSGKDRDSMYSNYSRFAQAHFFEVYRIVSAREIETMKTITIGQSSVTYFDLLKADSDRAMICARNSEVAKAFENDEYKRFKMYCGMLKAKFDRGLLRLRHVGEAATLLSEALGFADDSHPFYEMVLARCSDNDLKILVRSGEQEMSDGNDDFCVN